MISIRGLKIPDTSSASCQVASPRYHRREVQCDQKGSPCRSPCSWLGPMERVALGCSKVAMYKSHNTHDVVSPCFMCHAWCRWSLVSYKTWVCYNVVLANRTLTYYATKRSGSKKQHDKSQRKPKKTNIKRSHEQLDIHGNMSNFNGLVRHAHKKWQILVTLSDIIHRFISTICPLHWTLLKAPVPPTTDFDIRWLPCGETA